MPRPDDRPLKRLPQLEAHKATLERCVFCPKLCRSACPVSNAEPRETITPWGKMSTAYFLANESVEVAPSFAAPAWACTGCFGCREHCDHKNDVTGTLFEARSALAAEGVAPPAARRIKDDFASTVTALGNMTRELSVLKEAAPGVAKEVAVLVGCAYAKRPREARDAVRAIAKLTGAPDGSIAPIDVCCGAPLLYAGDKEGFARQGERLAAALAASGARRAVVVDAGCASAIRVHHAAASRTMPVGVEHFAETAGRELGRIGRVSAALAQRMHGDVRWHDPCQLGRGLGVYDAPRAVLARALGKQPSEFERRREDARCSGAGGLLPVTMPEVASRITKERLADHARSGGGTVVTGCASSLRRFEAEGARAIDLVTVVADALGCAEDR